MVERAEARYRSLELELESLQAEWSRLKSGERKQVNLDIDANRLILLDRVSANEPETEQIPF